MRTETNWTLLPFLIPALALSCVLCVRLGYTGPAFAGMLAVFFLAAVLCLLLLFVLSLAVVAAFVDKRKPQERCEPFYNAIVTYVMGLLCAFFRVRIHVRGADLVPDGGRFLLVENHRSAFDPFATGWVLRKRRLAFVSKPENLDLPILGAFLHKSCFLSIDRENDRAALKSILAAIRLVRDGVVSFAIYPEGTRNTGEGLLPFRNGAFKIAQKAKVPVVVAAIRGTDLVRGNFPWRPTDVYLEFCAVLDAETVARENTGEIGEKVRQCITSASF